MESDTSGLDSDSWMESDAMKSNCMLGCGLGGSESALDSTSQHTHFNSLKLQSISLQEPSCYVVVCSTHCLVEGKNLKGRGG